MPALHIGHSPLANRLFVAPRAGVTDRPFRQLCKALGAGYAVSEMVTSRKDLWNSLKTSRRANHAGEPGPIAVQIAGTEAAMMAEAAVYNIERGAEIIDIIAETADDDQARNEVASALGIGEDQAQAVLDMQLRRFSQARRRQLEEHAAQLRELLAAS